MKKIILFRHAKAIQENFENDFERTITNIGIERTKQVAGKTKQLVNNELKIWSSAANRTSQTAQIATQIWFNKNDSITFSKELYTFDVINLIEIIKKCSDSVENLIIFGHNYALTDFVNQFGSIYIESIPTSGFVSIVFESDSWQNISKGTTIDVIFPDKN